VYPVGNVLRILGALHHAVPELHISAAQIGSRPIANRIRGLQGRSGRPRTATTAGLKTRSGLSVLAQASRVADHQQGGP